MDEPSDTEITAVLLGFCTLDKTKRPAFVECLNNFVYASATQQRRLVDEWLKVCRDSTDPTIKRIAESAAVYTARPRKRRK
ncbi:hypothetical protein GCM10007862_12180 [Dyella lipolytica]|uniref:Uncharacterized protein n=1 Tax=Dyella lipolytica TaxID=1867835 RepID=A0ABW8IUG5_9GAMM|nr:hypothetical protein [Dyella lipolytica]GLQ46167.1 hypothetical protein GCM10007862_12180 [Dyella lipolytica]